MKLTPTYPVRILRACLATHRSVAEGHVMAAANGLLQGGGATRTRASRTGSSRMPREEHRTFSSTLLGSRSMQTSKKPTDFEGTARATRTASVHRE